MNNEISKYVHKHTTVVVCLILIMFIVLTMGEIVLYRNEMKLNQMISEGLIQLKEAKVQVVTPVPTRVEVTAKPTKAK